MSWFGSLFRALSASGKTGQDEARSLASLLAVEIQLYNEGALERLGAGNAMPAELHEMIVRSYWAYAERTSKSEGSRAVFCEEVGRILPTEGAARIEAIVQEAEATGPPPLEPR